MRAQKVKIIRSLERGLEVLQILQSTRSAKLNDLHRATGLSKATLLRVLLTLESQGLIWQRLADGAYLPSYSLHERARGLDDIDLLVEVASPVLEQLCQKVGWPSVLAVPKFDHMEVIETNSPRSYADHIRLGPVGFRANMLRSSIGRAYLAFCSEQEREATLARLKMSKNPWDALARDRKKVDALLEETRSLGYGTRTPDFGGDYSKTRDESDDGHDSIAVPITVYGQVVACINLSWTARVAKPKVIAERHLNDLSAAAAEIVAGMVAGRAPGKGRKVLRTPSSSPA